MKNEELILNLTDSTTKNWLAQQVLRLTGHFRISIVRYRKRRSDAQNRYLFGVVYPHVAAGIHEAYGQTPTKDAVHFMCKRMFNSVPLIDLKTGEEIDRLVDTTTKLTTTEFIEYIEQIAQFAAEKLGVVIPEPTASERDAF